MVSEIFYTIVGVIVLRWFNDRPKNWKKSKKKCDHVNNSSVYDPKQQNSNHKKEEKNKAQRRKLQPGDKMLNRNFYKNPKTH